MKGIYMSLHLTEVVRTSQPSETLPSLSANAGELGAFLVSGVCPKSDGNFRHVQELQQGENDATFLIHGNKASTTCFDAGLQGVHPPFDDFNPDYSPGALESRLSRYAVAHNRALEMSNWISSNVPQSLRLGGGQIDRQGTMGQSLVSLGLPSIKADLNNCGSYLLFHHFYTIDEIKLAAICSCKRHLICPLCAVRRAAKSVKAYMERYEVLQNQYPKAKPYLVTFTVKDGPNLIERFDHLTGHLRDYWAQRRKAVSSSCKHAPVEANKALGGVGSFEVKKGKGSGEWHPHAHWIWLCEQAPDAEKIQQEWYARTGDSFIVDVTPFHDTQETAGGFLEVFKYALKFSSMTCSDNWEAFLALRTRRLVSSFGIFRGVEVPEQETDEICFDDLPYYELVFRYIQGAYVLKERNVSPLGTIAKTVNPVSLIGADLGDGRA